RQEYSRQAERQRSHPRRNHRAETRNHRPLDTSKEVFAQSAFKGFVCVLNPGSLRTGSFMQRLFSTFPEGWPGAGLLFLRAVAAIPPFQHGIAVLLGAPMLVRVIPQMVAAGAAALLLIGLWTPVAGVLVAIAELCLTFAHPIDAWTHILIGT